MLALGLILEKQIQKTHKVYVLLSALTEMHCINNLEHSLN